MKILLINWMDMDNPMAGGAEVHLTEIFRRFVDRGDDVTLVASGFRGGSAEDNYHGIRILRIAGRETFNFAVPGFVRRLDRAENFDIVVEDINKIPFFTPLYLKKPLIVTVPHLFGSAVFRETNPLLASYVFMMERPIPSVYKNAVFEVISDSTASDLRLRGISPDRVRVVHCGMDHAVYSYDDSVGKFDRPTLLYLGRIKRYKSVDVILRALPEVAKQVPDVRLVVVGSGDYLENLKRLAEKLGIAGRVVFTGFVPPEEKVEWMRRSHVIVNPSPKEGWGLTNIEANACGTPAIASDADGLRDSVRDGDTGFLFPYGDHRVCAECAVKLLGDDALLRKMSENARNWALTFTWDEAASQTMTIVDELHRSQPR